MNYLQRILRRALLEAPNNSGQSLIDPFENEVSLNFDFPQTSRRLDLSVTTAESKLQPASVAPNTSAFEQKNALRQSLKPGNDPLIPPQSAAVQKTLASAELGELASDLPALKTLSEGLTPIAERHSTALEQADAFMRGLGLHFPVESPAAESIASNDTDNLPVGQLILPTMTENAARPVDQKAQIQTVSVKTQRITPPREVRGFDFPSVKTTADESPKGSVRSKGEPGEYDSYAKSKSQPNNTSSLERPAIRVITVKSEDKNSAAAWIAESARFGVGQL